MKCVNCGTDNNLRDRTANNGRCVKCHHPFAFEPQNMPPKLRFTDPFFQGAIAQLSNDDSLYFTSKQLHHFLDKKIKKKGQQNIIFQVFGYLFFGVWATGFLGTFLSIALKNINTYPIILFAYHLYRIIFSYRITQSSESTILQRRNNSRLLQVMGIILLVGLSAVFLLIAPSPLFFAVSVILGGFSLITGTRQVRRSRLIPQDFITTQEQVQDWIRRWENANGKIEKLLRQREQETETSRELSGEITNYSFDRAVICDRAEIARFLIANNFHFENNCAVLSVTGYPQNIFSTVLEMLKRNPNLKIYALHSCTPRGVQLAYHLQTSPNWFGNHSIQIYEVGILPRQVFNQGDFFILNSPRLGEETKQFPRQVKEKLLPEEIEWLEKGNYIELESLSPRRIIQALTQAISQSRTAEMTGDSVSGNGGDLDAGETYFLFSSFQGDNSRSSVFASDSFG